MNVRIIFLCLLTLCFTTSHQLHADVVTDGSVGAAQSLTGPDYAIPETLGTIKGNNLFHSFEQFSIKTEESATFTGSDAIQNVISRVTGTEISEIDGTIRSNVGSADFYFINPNGIVFGPNAKVDVPAAFHLSTADELKFTDGSSFKASSPEMSTLTQSAPESFGFLGIKSASIEVNGSTLEFAHDSKVSLTSSKDIIIKGTEEKQAALLNEGGDIEFKANSNMLMDNAEIDVSGNGGGTVTVKAGNVNFRNKSTISADNTGDQNADGGIEVQVNNQFELSNGAQLSSSTWSNGNAGYVKINAGQIKIDGQAINEEYTGVWSDTYSCAQGDAGTIEITVSGLIELSNDAQISSSTSSQQGGDAGDIIITASDLKIYDDGENQRYTGIWSDTYTDSQGNAGDVRITVSNLIQMLNDSRISSDTYSQGDGGTIIIKASELLELLNGAQISSSTFSEGDGGLLKITAGNLTIDGKNSGVMTLSYNGDEIDDNAEGNAGEIEIAVEGEVIISDGGTISGITLSKGDGGDISLTAQNLTIDGQGENGQLTSIVNDTYSEGNAGEISIKVDDLAEILDGGEISSSTTSEGDGGSVTISAGNLTIDDEGNEQFTGIFSDTHYGQGNAGSISLEVAGLLEILNGAQVSTTTYSKGDAGTLSVSANSLTIDAQNSEQNYTGILSETYDEGNGGTISINADRAVINSGYIGSTANEESTGYAGNITVNTNHMTLMDKSIVTVASLQKLSEEQIAEIPQNSITINSKELMLDNTSVIISYSAQNVPASTINIEANQIIVSNDSRINSAANMADGGDINIQGEDIFLYDGLITTSVKGDTGDGGNITISGISDDQSVPADFLVMQGGFIQANSAAEDGSGGEIEINVRSVIADQAQRLEIGGQERKEFAPDKNENVIQSAAPDGYPGEINISGVQLDISGSIINMATQFSDELPLATDLCQNIGTEMASSLIQMGQGGFPEMPSDLSSISFSSKMVDELLLSGDK